MALNHSSQSHMTTRPPARGRGGTTISRDSQRAVGFKSGRLHWRLPDIILDIFNLTRAYEGQDPNKEDGGQVPGEGAIALW